MKRLYGWFGVAAVLMLISPMVALAQFSPAYVVAGTSDVDLAGCAQQGPEGATAVTFSVLRRYDIAGPTQVSISNLPANVSVTLSPATLTYPGWVTGQVVTATFTSVAGVQIPDSVVQITAADSSNSVSADLLVHGTCPRQNKDFVIRGSFGSVHQSTFFPVEGALVEIYRDVAWQVDQWVGSTITASDGSFEVRLWANDTDTYYAKLRLNDVAGVYLHDWWTPSIKDYNSATRGSNSQPIVDVGGTVITVDGGSGTPKSAVWQGGRAAYQEFTHTFSHPPPTGDYEIVIQNTPGIAPWTARSTTNYEEGYGTAKFSDVSPVAQSDPSFDPYFSQFDSYSTNFHEFGHALRHTVDGNQNHFLNDAERWTYARKHTLCGSASGYIDVEGFAFNEGWAEYWQMDSGQDLTDECPSVPVTDMTKEGAVMNDLLNVAHTIDACFRATGNRAAIVQAQRRNMFSIVNRGQNIMHSDGEFRNNAIKQFPGCTLPPPGVGVAETPLSVRSGIPQTVAASLARLNKRAIFYQNVSHKLASELAGADRAANETRVCRTPPCKTFVAVLTRPHILRGQIAYAKLIQNQFTRRVAQYREARMQVPDISAEGIEREHADRERFRLATSQIVMETLEASAHQLDAAAELDKSGEVRSIADNFRRTARRLQMRGPRNGELFTVLQLPSPPDDDKTSARESHVRLNR